MATIVHFELPANDVARAKGFWEDVFGWSFQGMEGGFEYLMTQGEEPVGASLRRDGCECGESPAPPTDRRTSSARSA